MHKPFGGILEIPPLFFVVYEKQLKILLYYDRIDLTELNLFS